jgi:NADH-quinone oxidoreductase subunit M
MVNHGLVVAPLMLIAVLLVARAGTDDITKMGGLAMRAPVLAALFLIATMALLAMPGSSNFVGEFYILNGIFQEKIVYAFVAAIGIALSAYYALRLYQHAMHNRKPDGIESREVGLLNGGVIAGLVACIVGLALWPGLILHRTERSTSTALAATCTTPQPEPQQAAPASYGISQPVISVGFTGCPSPQQIKNALKILPGTAATPPTP